MRYTAQTKNAKGRLPGNPKKTPGRPWASRARFVKPQPAFCNSTEGDRLNEIRTHDRQEDGGAKGRYGQFLQVRHVGCNADRNRPSRRAGVARSCAVSSEAIMCAVETRRGCGWRKIGGL